MQIDIAIYRRALVITDTQQDDEITRVAERVEGALLNYLGFPSFAEFYYEFGENEIVYTQFEAAAVNSVVRIYDDPTEEPITPSIRAWLRPYRVPSVG